jgi:type I restriction enzyme R subunit
MPNARVGQTERETQNHVIELFRNPQLLGYTYLGDWQDRENHNIEIDRLIENLKKRGYSETLVRRAVEELRKTAVCSNQRELCSQQGCV